MNNVPHTILVQLGGLRFKTMTGARNFVSGDYTLTFDLPGKLTKGRINKVRIELKASDTYTIDFMRYSPKHLEIVENKKVEGVLFTNLGEVFTSYTGLDTHTCRG